MDQQIPQHAIDTLPEGYTILGFGGTFKTDGEFAGLGVYGHTHDTWDESHEWAGAAPHVIYAAPHDSEIVELNSGSLPDTMKQRRIYIAGPMTGKKYFNFPAFDAAKDYLTSQGYDVVSPADIDRDYGFDALDLPEDTDWYDLSIVPMTEEGIIDRDLHAIKTCDEVYMLDGWDKSTGAQAEHWVALWRGKSILYQTPVLQSVESVCQEAHRIQGGDRQQDYGDPRDNFSDIAELWEVFLSVAHEYPYNITPEDVANMMILMKMARHLHKPKRDNTVDICGYAQCLAKMQNL